MSQKSSTFINICKIALAVCVIGIFVNGNHRSKLDRKMAPFIREYETMNSTPYQALSFLEGVAHGYSGNYGAGINRAKQEYMREDHLLYNVNDLYRKWKSANRLFYLSIWGAVISGVLWGIAAATASPQVAGKQ